MRALWSGALQVGLVSIPVKLYSATEDNRPHFRLITKDTHCPVSYKKICSTTGEAVENENVVRGYEYEDGNYVEIDDDDLASADPKRAQMIDIDRFVGEHDIAPKYFERSYFLTPDPKFAKAYALLRDTLKKTNRVGIAEVVIRGRERFIALRPANNQLVVHQLRFESELAEPEDVEIPNMTQNVHYSDDELEMMLNLVDEKSGVFRPERYEDTYAQGLERVIRAKISGKEIEHKEEKKPVFTDMDDLLAALEKSVGRDA